MPSKAIEADGRRGPRMTRKPGLMSYLQIARLCHVTVDCVRHWKWLGKMPPPVLPTAGCCRWRRGDIMAWLESTRLTGPWRSDAVKLPFHFRWNLTAARATLEAAPHHDESAKLVSEAVSAVASLSGHPWLSAVLRGRRLPEKLDKLDNMTLLRLVARNALAAGADDLGLWVVVRALCRARAMRMPSIDELLEAVHRPSNTPRKGRTKKAPSEMPKADTQEPKPEQNMEPGFCEFGS